MPDRALGKTQDLTDSLVGLTLPEMFDRFIRDDPEVEALAKLAIQKSSGEASFLDLRNRHYVFSDALWPIVTSEWIDLGGVWGPLLYSEATEADADLMKTVTNRFNLIMDPLQSGRLVGSGHLADGRLGAINRGIWSSEGYFIDFTNSSVGNYREPEEHESDERFVPIWSAVALELPRDSVTNQTQQDAGKKLYSLIHEEICKIEDPDAFFEPRGSKTRFADELEAEFPTYKKSAISRVARAVRRDLRIGHKPD